MSLLTPATQRITLSASKAAWLEMLEIGELPRELEEAIDKVVLPSRNDIVAVELDLRWVAFVEVTADDLELTIKRVEVVSS
jgi:hypothetical protein